jgi:flagellar motor switch protein FliG
MLEQVAEHELAAGQQAGTGRLSGGVKAALMLLCIGKPMAARLVERLSRSEVMGLVASAKSLNRVSRVEIDAMIDSFSEMYGKTFKFMGTEEEVIGLLSEVLPEEMADVLGPPRAEESADMQTAEPPVWDRLTAIKPEKIAAFLDGEHVQVAAAALDTMDRTLASSIIPLLAQPLRTEVLRRMIVVQPMTQRSRELLEQVFQQELLGEDPDAKTAAKRQDVADIINAMKPADVRMVLSDLQTSEPDTAKALGKLLFSFTDMALLGDEAISMVLDTVGTEQLGVALQGADAALREKLLSCVSARARRMVESELASGAKAGEDAILASQRLISSTALKLQRDGSITLPDTSSAA